MGGSKIVSFAEFKGRRDETRIDELAQALMDLTDLAESEPHLNTVQRAEFEELKAFITRQFEKMSADDIQEASIRAIAGKEKNDQETT